MQVATGASGDNRSTPATPHSVGLKPGEEEEEEVRLPLRILMSI